MQKRLMWELLQSRDRDGLDCGNGSVRGDIKTQSEQMLEVELVGLWNRLNMRENKRKSDQPNTKVFVTRN